MESGFEEQAQSSGVVTYVLQLSAQDVREGAVRVLTRNGKRLEVKVPPGTRNLQTVRLRNALRLTDGREGDIMIRVHVERESDASGVDAVVDGTFESEVLKAPVPVVVDFWAAWCGPCRAVAPVVERLASQYGDRVRFRKLNVDENPLASRKYQVASIPTILIFKNGRIAGVSVGAVSESELRSRIESALAGE